jgi:lactate racemase
MIMNTFQLPYGHDHIEFELPPQFQADLILPAETPPAADPMQAVSDAVDIPFDGSDLEQFAGARTVAIAINDKTRPVPHEYLLPPLLNKLEQMGISRETITLLIATGTHAPMPDDEFKRIIPQDIINNYRIITHDCDNESSLVFLGHTTHGTPVFINKLFVESDLRIVVGNIEPHHFMGFSGGVKSAVVGLAGRKTINTNHVLMLEPDARVAEYVKNPPRQDAEEMGRIVGIHFALNAVLNTSKQIVQVFFGDPQAVMDAGIPISRQVCQTAVKGQYDLVFASAGGLPKDINLYQAQKGLTHGSMLTKDGGVVILAAACPEGSGSAGYENYVKTMSSHQEVIDDFRRTGFRVGPHKAFQIARVATRVNLILVSEMPPSLVKSLLITPANNLKEAFDLAVKMLPSNPQIAIMPKATSTVPIFE